MPKSPFEISSIDDSFKIGKILSTSDEFAAPKDAMLPTKRSTLSKILEGMSRVDYAKNAAVLALMRGRPDKVGSDVWSALKGEKKFEGTKIVEQLSGRPVQIGDPKTTKLIKGIGGFALDALTSPWNLVGIGGLTKAGKAVQGTEKLGETLASRLASGQASVASIGRLHTPDAVNMAVGRAGKAVFKALDRAPIIGDAMRLFRKPLDKLLPTAMQAESKAIANIFKELKEHPSEKLGEITKRGERAFLPNGEGWAALPQRLRKHYETVGYTPQEVFGAEVVRHLEGDIIQNQGALRDTWKKLFKEAKDPAERAYALEMFKILRGTPNKGGSTGAVQEAVGIMKPGYKRQIDKMTAVDPTAAEAIGYAPRMFGKEAAQRTRDIGSVFRPGTAGGRKAFDLYAYSKSRKLGEYTTEQLEQMARNPITRQHIWGDALGMDPLEKSASIFKTAKAADDIKPGLMAPVFSKDVSTAYGYHLANTERAASSADAIGYLLNQPEFARANPVDWFKDGVRGIAHVDVPPQFQKMFEKYGKDLPKGTNKVWMPNDVAKEFRTFTEKLTNIPEFNTFLKGYDFAQDLFKRGVLIGILPTFPIVGLPRAMKNFMGDNFLSWFAGASSVDGAKWATPLTKILLNQKELQAGGKLEEAIAKLPTVMVNGKRLNLAQEAKTLADSGIMHTGIEVGELTGLRPNTTRGAIGKTLDSPALFGWTQKFHQASDNWNRIQHYLTRRMQGWDAAVAIKDTQKYHYDYAHGLSDFEKQVMRRLIPFYSWMRFNVPAMVSQSLKHPGRVRTVQAGIDNIEASIGKPEPGREPNEKVLDQFLNGQLKIRLYEDGDGKWRYFRLKNFLPLADIEDVTSVNGAIDWLVGSASPFIKLPIETYTNKSAFFKKPGGGPADIERYTGEQGTFLGMPMRKKTINVLKSVPMLTDINRYNPANIFGTDTVASIFGAKNPSVQMTSGEKVIRALGLPIQPVDLNKSAENAKFEFRRQLSELKQARTRQLKLGYPTQDVENRLRSLLSEAQ